MNSVSPLPVIRSRFPGGPFVRIGGLTLLSLVILLTSTIPLGIPGEWTWARRAWLEIDPLATLGTAILGLGYWSAVRWGERWLSRFPHITPANVTAQLPRRLLLASVLLGLTWQGGLLLLPPDYQGIARSPTVLYYKRTEGYFWQAAFDITDTQRFLREYHKSISEGNDPDRYLHLGTHPPGLTLSYRFVLSLFEHCPPLAKFVTTTEPPAVREALNTLRDFPTPHGLPLSLAEEATLWSATLLTLIAIAMASWPIGRLAARIAGPVAGWRAAVLWPLVPSLLVFFPKSDLLCPLIATSSCWLWLEGWSRRRWGICCLAGVGFFGGLMLTLALAPVALLLAVQTIAERSTRRAEFASRSLGQDVQLVLAATAGLVVPIITLSAWGDCPIVSIWIENLRNHALFYTHNTRSYALWLLINPLEAALALGLPIASLVGLGLWRNLGSRTARPMEWSHNVAWLAVWVILWVSGKNMGEAARLWIFLAPWPVISAAAVTVAPSADAVLTNRFWTGILGLQLLATIVTTNVIDGFHFAELITNK